ncbi:MAG: hypothetical protein LRS43_03375 [Desulfurococcales archaeon]|nr:hypothetical protein [Desulfurococcales archaeon]
MRAAIFTSLAAGIYMAIWAYAETLVASQLGIGRFEGALAGVLAGFWLFARLEGALVASRRLRSANARRLLFLSSPIVFGACLSVLPLDTFTGSLLVFSFLTAYMGALTASALSTIYNETDDREWTGAVSVYRALSTLVQVATFSALMAWSPEDPPVTIILPAGVASVIASTSIRGYIISSISLKTLDAFADAAAFMRAPRRPVLGSDLVRMASAAGGLAAAKMLLLPHATRDSLFMGLSAYSLGYLAGILLALKLRSPRMVSLTSLACLALSLWTDNSMLALTLVSAALGYSEVAGVLLILDYRPRMVSQATSLFVVWSIIGAVAVGAFSLALPERAITATAVVAIIGLLYAELMGRRERRGF